MQTGDRGRPERAARIRRRDRHGRGLRGVLAPPGVPLHRTRAERFDDLVLQAVARLEPRWEAHLAGVEFAVEEIPPSGTAIPGPVPLGRLEPGSGGTVTEEIGWPPAHAEPAGPVAPDGVGWPAVPGDPASTGPPGRAAPGGAGPDRGSPGAGPDGGTPGAGPDGGTPGAGPDGGSTPGAGPGGQAQAATGTSGGQAEGSASRPPRIVVYRRPLMARADSEEDLGELVFEVIVEEFARLLGVDPADVDPGYPEDD